MNQAVDTYTVSDVLSLVRRPVDVHPHRIYREIGIRSFGRGIFHKDPVSGDNLGDKRVFYIEPGDLLFSNVFAWEGAVALASEQERNMIGSHRFMTYEVNATLADSRYLLYYFTEGPGQDIIRQASPGSAGRNKTLGIERFASQSIKLPCIDEQAHIATRLDAAMNVVACLVERRTAQWKMCTAASDTAVTTVFQRGMEAGWPLRKIGEVAKVNPRLRRPSPDTMVTFVPMAALSEITGKIESPEYREAGTVGNGYKQFERDDLIFAKITPCMQNGKSAVFFNSRTEIGFGSSEFHVVRPFHGVLPEWIHAWVRSRDFLTRAMLAFTGTAGQQRVSASFLESATIPVPPTESEQRDSLSLINRIHEKRLHFRNLEVSQEEHLRALRHSLLNAAFNGQL